MNSKQRFLSYLKGQKKSIAFLSFSVLGFLLANLSQPLFVGLALDDALAGNQASFVLILSLSLAFSLLGGVLDFFFEYSVSRMTQEVIFGIRKDVFCKYNSVSIGFLFGKKDGDMLQLEIGDIENVANGLFSAFKSLVEGILTILITIILIFSLNWILALSVILLTPLSFFVSRFVARFSRKYFRKQAGLMSGLNEVSMEALGNSDLLAALDAKESSEEGFARKNEVLKNESRIALFSASWTNPTTRLVNNTIYALVGIGGIVLIGLTRDQNATLLSLGALMTIGRLSSFLSYTNQYTKPFNEISGVVGDYEQAASSFHRISAFLDTEDDIDS
ncbi:MAG: ABC transporter transmembrane domain-containing protein, partial [Bacilli bacterium]